MRKVAECLSLVADSTNAGEETAMRPLTNTGRYWKLFTSDPSLVTPLLSRSTKLISMMRVSPALINVYPNTVCTMVESGKLCG